MQFSILSGWHKKFEVYYKKKKKIQLLGKKVIAKVKANARWEKLGGFFQLWVVVDDL